MKYLFPYLLSLLLLAGSPPARAQISDPVR